MRQRITGEQLVISALLLNGDVHGAEPYGVTVDHFRGYAEEYKWLLNYDETYGACPTTETFAEAFEDFRVCNHTLIRSAVDALFRTFYGRRMIEAMKTATIALQDGDLERAWQILARSEPRRTVATAKNIVTDASFLDSYEKEEGGITLPHRTLDRLTGGIGKGQLWYLGGRTGNGKSAYLCDWATYAMLAGCRVIFYSLEMTEMEMRGRIHAILARTFGYDGLTSFDIKNRIVDRTVYKNFLHDLEDRIDSHMHVITPADGPVTPGSLAVKADAYDLIVVDHIGLMRPDDGGHATDDWRIAARISNSLKELTLSSGTPVLAAAQVNREGEHSVRMPEVKNLAGTDALGQDADVVVMLKSLEYDVATRFHLPKNRHGYAKRTWFSRFDPNHGRFDEISEDIKDDLIQEADEVHDQYNTRRTT
jgi:replicative DNA helicase